MARKLPIQLLFLSLFVVFASIFSMGTAEAAYQIPCPDGSTNLPDNPGRADSESHSCCPNYVSKKTPMNCLTAKYLNPTIRLLSYVVGIAAVIAIIAGGIRYSTSAGDPQKSDSGKKLVTNAIYGLLVYIFLFSIIQFFSPGGIQGKPLNPDGSASTTADAATCTRTFFGLKPWYAYLPPDGVDSKGKKGPMFDDNCQVVGFNLLPEGGTGGASKSNLPSVLLVIADDLVRIAGLVAVAFVITGGIKLITSQGEPDKTKQGRDTVLNALIGLLIAIVAAAVVSYIGSNLAK